MKPYYEEESVTLYLGDCREMPAIACDLAIADPPYGETSLAWDRWQDGWPATVPGSALWCFGSLGMFTDHWGDFATWRRSQDIVWEKQNGSSFHADRFRRVHEQAVFFYRGAWGDVYKATVTTQDAVRKQVRRKQRPPHMGHIDAGAYESHDGGPRMMRSVIYAPNCHGYAEHPTQKPLALLLPLIKYGCRPGGTVYVPFAGVGSELEAARWLGRKAIGVEIDERYCEKAALRLSRRMFPEPIQQQEARGLLP